jgi:hypothetical protein
MNGLGRHIPLFGELARGNRFAPEVSPQFFFDERELTASWDKRTSNVSTKIMGATRAWANDLLIKSRAARHRSGECNLLRKNVLSRFWSRRWATPLATFYGVLLGFSSLSLTDL